MANAARGHIEQLPSGSFRVDVYAGTDPVTGRRRRLREGCPDEVVAAATLGRLLNEADGDRFPNRAATLGQALDKYHACDRRCGPLRHHSTNRPHTCDSGRLCTCASR